MYGLTVERSEAVLRSFGKEEKKVKSKVLLISLALVLVIGTVAVGCAPAEVENVIILGAPLSTGYPDGVAAEENLQLAVDKINADGGVTCGGTTYDFRLVVRDTRDLEPGVPVSETLSILTKLITDDDADFIVGGPIRSEAAIASLPKGAEYETIFVWSAGFLHPALGWFVEGSHGYEATGGYDKGKYLFRTQGTTAPLVGEAAQILSAINATFGLSTYHSPRCWIVYQDVAHGQSASDKINTALLAAGWNITGMSAVSTGDSTPFPTILASADAAETQILFCWFDMPASAELIKDWYAGQYKMLPVGFVVPCLESQAWGLTNNATEYTVFVYPKGGITDWSTEAEAYITLYSGAGLYGGTPARTWVGPTCFEVPYILKAALESSNVTSPDDTANIIAALEATDYTGVYGKVSFNPTTHEIIGDANQDPSTGAVTTWVQWQSPGVQVALYPDAVGDINDMVLPSWGIHGVP